MNSKYALLFLSLIVVVSCASTPSGQSFESPIGKWSEKYESMSGKKRSSVVTIVDNTHGSYTNPNGRIEFYSINDPGVWEGYWIEESGSSPCSVEKSGSLFWGVQVYEFNSAYNQYTGYWDNCGAGKRYPTKGVR